jgi:hypothetical protein
MMLAAPLRPSSTTPPQIYRQFFTPVECRLLDSSPLESALSEISLLRILLMRLLAAARRKRPFTLKGRLSMLAAFSEAGFVMSSLVRFNAKYCGLGDPSDMLLQIFAEMDPYDL